MAFDQGLENARAPFQMPLYSISEEANGQARHRNLYYAGLHRRLLLALLPIVGPPARLETKLVVALPVYLPQC